jgi:excisionase family DNA binding protein
MNSLKKTDIEVERLYLVHEIAEILHLHPVTVRRFIREKRLPAVKLGRDWRISQGMLQKYLVDTFG